MLVLWNTGLPSLLASHRHRSLLVIITPSCADTDIMMADRRFYTSPRCLHNPRCCHRAVGCYFWYIPESCKIRHGNIAPYHAAEDQVESKWLGTLIRKIFLITSWAKVQLECSDGWLTVEVIAMIWRTQSYFSRGKSLLLPTISAVSVSNVGRNWQREPTTIPLGVQEESTRNQSDFRRSLKLNEATG